MGTNNFANIAEGGVRLAKLAMDAMADGLGIARDKAALDLTFDREFGHESGEEIPDGAVLLRVLTDEEANYVLTRNLLEQETKPVMAKVSEDGARIPACLMWVRPLLQMAGQAHWDYFRATVERASEEGSTLHLRMVPDSRNLGLYLSKDDD